MIVKANTIPSHVDASLTVKSLLDLCRSDEHMPVFHLRGNGTYPLVVGLPVQARPLNFHDLQVTFFSDISRSAMVATPPAPHRSNIDLLIGQYLFDRMDLARFMSNDPQTVRSQMHARPC